MVLLLTVHNMLTAQISGAFSARINLSGDRLEALNSRAASVKPGSGGGKGDRRIIEVKFITWLLQ